MPQPDDIHPFAAGFEPSTDEQWRSLVDKVLNGAPFDRLISSTADGIAIPPLVHRADDPIRPIRQAGSWLAACRIDHVDSDDVNTQALNDVAGGANALQLVVAGSAGDYGFGVDPETPGVIASALKNIDPANTAIILDLPASAPKLASETADFIEASGLNPAQANVSFGLNPLHLYLADSVSDGELSEAASTASSIAQSLTQRGFGGPLLCADARTIHAAGASEAQELAYLLASATHYLRMMEPDGFNLSNAAQWIGFRLAADADQFLTIAKLRALRRLFARVADVCDLADLPITIHTETAWRMMTRYDPWLNVLRATMATFSSVIGGADSVSVIPHSQVAGLPEEQARRLSRNVHSVLREEAHIDAVSDPAGGSGGLEQLTSDLCERAWTLFQQFEKAGGLVNSITDGSLADMISETREKRQQQVARGILPITGTSTFPNLGEKAPEVLVTTQDAIGIRFSPPFRPIRLANEFETLRDEVEAYAHENQRPNVFLANFGPLAAYNSRANFIQNFVAAAGFDVVSSDSLASAEQAAKAFSSSGCFCACICSSDELLVAHAQEWVKVLKSDQQKPVLIAQKPVQKTDTTDKSAADRNIYDGCNRIEILEKLVSAFKKQAVI